MASTRTTRVTATLARVALLAAAAAAALWWAAAPAHAEFDVVDVDELVGTVETFGDVEDARTDGDDTFYMLGVDAAAFTSPWSGDLVFVNEHGRGDRGPYRYGFLQVHLGGGDRADDVLAVRGPRDSGSWDADTPVEVRATDVSEALDTPDVYCEPGERPGGVSPSGPPSPPPVTDGPLQGDCVPPPGTDVYGDDAAGTHAPLYSSDGRWYDSSTGRPAYFGPCGEPGTAERTSDAQVHGQVRQPDGTLTDVYYVPDGNPNDCEQPPATDEGGAPLGEPTFVVAPHHEASYCAAGEWEATGADDLPDDAAGGPPGPPPETDEPYEHDGSECVPPPGVHYEIGQAGVHWPILEGPDGLWYDSKTGRQAYFGPCGEPGRELDPGESPEEGREAIDVPQPNGETVRVSYKPSGFEPGDAGCQAPGELDDDFCDLFPDHEDCPGSGEAGDGDGSDGHDPGPHADDDLRRPEPPPSTNRRRVLDERVVRFNERPAPSITGLPLMLTAPDAAHVGGQARPATVTVDHGGTVALTCAGNCRFGDYELLDVDVAVSWDVPNELDRGGLADWDIASETISNGRGQSVGHFYNAPASDDLVEVSAGGTAQVRLRERWTERYEMRAQDYTYGCVEWEEHPVDPDDEDGETEEVCVDHDWISVGGPYWTTYAHPNEVYRDEFRTVPAGPASDEFPVLSATSR